MHIIDHVTFHKLLTIYQTMLGFYNPLEERF